MQEFKIVRNGQKIVLTDKELQEAIEFALKQENKVAVGKQTYDHLVKCEEKVFEIERLYNFIFGEEN